jgi:hypothetical protein
MLMAISWPTGLGSSSSTMGSTVTISATNVTAPTRRRRARFLS